MSRITTLADELARESKDSLKGQKPVRFDCSPLVLKELQDLSPQAKQEIAHRLNNRLQLILLQVESLSWDPKSRQWRSPRIERAVDEMRAEMTEMFGI